MSDRKIPKGKFCNGCYFLMDDNACDGWHCENIFFYSEAGCPMLDTNNYSIMNEKFRIKKCSACLKEVK